VRILLAFPKLPAPVLRVVVVSNVAPGASAKIAGPCYHIVGRTRACPLTGTGPFSRRTRRILVSVPLPRSAGVEGASQFRLQLLSGSGRTRPRRRLIADVGLAILLGLVMQPEPSIGHLYQERSMGRVVDFVGELEAFGGTASVIIRHVATPTSTGLAERVAGDLVPGNGPL
jgi:hypothetical protein